jgi:hypothetical protein
VDGAVTDHTDFVARGGPAGGFSVTQASARLSLPLAPIDQRWFPAVSFRYRHLALDRDPGTPIPETLKSLSVSLSASGVLSPDWSFFGSVSPGLADAGGGFTSRGLGIGVIAIATRRFADDFSGGLGVVYDSLARGTGRIFPVATLDWRPAPGWRAFLGFPRTGVAWQVSEALRAEFVGEADFGSFHVASDPAPGGGNRPPLDRTRLEYQAVRVGPALTWQAAPAFRARLAAGVVPVLDVEYRKRNYELKSDTTAAFASLEFTWRL